MIVASAYLPDALRLGIAFDSTLCGGRGVDHTESRTEQRTESAGGCLRRWPRGQEADPDGRLCHLVMAGCAGGAGLDRTVAAQLTRVVKVAKVAGGQRTVCAGQFPPVPGGRGGQVVRGAGAGGRA